MGRRATAVFALICIALILVGINVIVAECPPVQLDLTAGKLYTLSDGTKRTLARIDEPITLRLYYSSRLGERAPAVGVYADRVRELLTEYAATAHGKIRLEIYDPLPYSDTEDRAVAFGLQGVPLGSSGEQGYFGLAGTNSTDDQQVIAFFAPAREQLVEYDLTRLVHALAFPKKTVIGLMSMLPLEGDVMAMIQHRPTQPAAIISELRKLDTVETVSTTVDAIPPDIDVLMLVHPIKLPEKTVYAIDQFVLGGGKALIFVDPYSEYQAARVRTANPAALSSDLNRLFRSWGFEVPPDTIAADRRYAAHVSINRSGRGPELADYVAWLDLRRSALDRNDVITADLDQVRMASAGIIEPLKGAQTTIEPLIETSTDAMKLPTARLEGMPDVAGLFAGFKPDHKRYILAAHVTGMAKTAFPGGPPPDPDAKKPGPPAAPKPAAAKPAAAPLKQSAKPINLVVVADTDILDDRFWVQTQDIFGQRVAIPIANNGAFVANAVDALAGGEDLIGLRTRGTSVRPFEVVDRIQREAQQHYSAEEQRLQQKLQSAQARLRDLTGGDDAKASANLSPAELRTIAQFRLDMLQTRRALRAVQAALLGDIDRLEATIEFLDIAAVPLIVAAAAIILGAVRLRRRRGRSAAV